MTMTIPTNHAFETRMQIDRVVRQAQAARAEAIRATARNFTAALKRLFAALRPQAAH
jgi:hypothetical protein